MYQNLASNMHPATVIYLMDISSSMRTPMHKGKTRIEHAKIAIQVAYAQMIQRSLRQGRIHARYRVGMLAYSDSLCDVYGGVVTIDKRKDERIPSLTPRHGTNMVKVFRSA